MGYWKWIVKVESYYKPADRWSIDHLNATQADLVKIMQGKRRNTRYVSHRRYSEVDSQRQEELRKAVYGITPR